MCSALCSQFFRDALGGVDQAVDAAADDAVGEAADGAGEIERTYGDAIRVEDGRAQADAALPHLVIRHGVAAAADLDQLVGRAAADLDQLVGRTAVFGAQHGRLHARRQERQQRRAASAEGERQLLADQHRLMQRVRAFDAVEAEALEIVIHVQRDVLVELAVQLDQIRMHQQHQIRMPVDEIAEFFQRHAGRIFFVLRIFREKALFRQRLL